MRHAFDGCSYGRGVLPAGSLPNPSDPTFIAIGAVIGGFVGRMIARRRRYDADKMMQATADGSYCGIGVALACYLLANLAEASLR